MLVLASPTLSPSAGPNVFVSMRLSQAEKITSPGCSVVLAMNIGDRAALPGLQHGPGLRGKRMERRHLVKRRPQVRLEEPSFPAKALHARDVFRHVSHVVQGDAVVG